MKAQTKVKTLIQTMMLAGIVAGASYAKADSVEKLEAQLKTMQAEINRLKEESAKRAAPDGGDTSELKAQVDEIRKKAVTAGDMPGSFRLPGSDTSMQIYGFVDFHWIKDFKATAGADNFSDVAELSTNSSAVKRQSKMTVQTSRFGVQTATPISDDVFKAKLEMDFYDYCGSSLNNNACNRNRLRVRHAYGEYGGFLIGQTSSLWSDGNDSPNTVDFNGPIGGTFIRLPQIRYSYDIPQIATIRASLEYAQGFGSGMTDNSIGQTRPNVVLRVDKKFSWGQLNARVLSSSHRKVDAGQSVEKEGFGYGIGGSFKLSSADTITAQYNVVEGDYNWEYMNPANGLVYSSSKKTIYNDSSKGYMVGWEHVFSPKWSSNIAYSAVTTDESQDYLAAYGSGANKKLTQYHLNTFYKPIKNVSLGVEYIGGKRETYDATNNSASMSRIDFRARYTF